MKKLSEIRFEKKKTQLTLMLESGVSMSRISLIENDKFIPNEREKLAIATAMGVRVEDVDWPTLAVVSTEGAVG